MKEFIKPLEITALVLSLLVISYLFSYSQLPDFRRDTVEILTKNNQLYSMNVELAVSDNEQAFGLMYRTSLPDDLHGMLFIYKHTQMVSMWMKNTNFFLDMLFIDKNGRVVKIARNAVPGSTKHIKSGEPVRAVLELRTGVANKFKVGDTILHSVFNNVKKKSYNLGLQKEN